MRPRPMLSLAASLALLALAGAPRADEERKKPETPAALRGGAVVSAGEARTLLAEGKARFFDTRSAVNFGKGHVPGARPLPYKEKSAQSEGFDASLDSFDVSALPADKGEAIVFYSDGPTGWKSYKAAVTAIRRGHRNVKWMREGFAGWAAARFPVE